MSEISRASGGLGGALCHRSVWVRVAAALCVALVVFYGIWAVSYAWLPEGSFRFASALTGPQVTEGNGDALSSAMVIFFWNLAVAGGIVAVASLFAVGRVSCGYLVPLVWAAVYGGLLGTNSFALPDPARPMAPNLNVVWTRAGLREIAGYVLIASALAGVYLWRQAGWWSGKVERVRRWREVRLSQGEIVCLAVAVAMLGWAAWVEGSQIALAGLP